MILSNITTAYTFDDLMLVPQHSEVRSRKAPNVSTSLGTVNLDIPIISSPMNTITEVNMAVALSNLGAGGVVHRFMSPDAMIQMGVKIVTFGCGKKVFFAIGATGDYLDRAYRLYDTLGLTNFCIDVANGHSEICLTAVRNLRERIPKANIMAGNVCTREGTYRLAAAGANIIRVGIGGGSMCKTRIVTGYGVPQLTAIEDCVSAKYNPTTKYQDITIVADGGIRNSGDIVKAFAAGADAVMLGGLLAGTDETPGELLADSDGFHYKKYAGMASKEGRKFNGWFAEEDASFIPEGESTSVPCKGPVKGVIDQLIGGLRVGMSYAGAMTLKELHENAEWIRITENGRIEGTPHGK